MARPSVSRSQGQRRSWAAQKWRIRSPVRGINAESPEPDEQGKKDPGAGRRQQQRAAHGRGQWQQSGEHGQFPQNPDSGGRPATTKVHSKNARPKPLRQPGWGGQSGALLFIVQIHVVGDQQFVAEEGRFLIIQINLAGAVGAPAVNGIGQKNKMATAKVELGR